MKEKLLIKKMATKMIIENYKEDVDSLQNWLSAWNPKKFCYKFSCYLREEDQNRIIVPGALDIQQLEKHLSKFNLEYEDLRSKLDPHRKVKFSLKFPPRDYKQNKAIQFLKKEPHTQKFLNADTDFGKTYCCLNYVFHSGKLPIVMVDQLSLAKQWVESILFFTTIKEDEIYLISGQKSIDKLLKMKKDELEKYKFFIGMYLTLETYTNNNNLESLTKLFSMLQIGLKVYDEAHVRMVNIAYIDELTNCESLYLTATPGRSEPIENALYKRIFRNVTFFKSLNEKTTDKFRNVIFFKWDSKPTLKEETNMKNNYGFDANKYCNKYLVKDKFNSFMSILNDFINEIFDGKHTHKVVILGHTLDFIQRIYDNLDIVNKDLSIGKFDSKIKNIAKRKLELEKDIVLTTDKSFGKALSIESLDILINTVPFSSVEVILPQMIGRLRHQKNNREVFFVDVLDTGFTSIRNQYNIKLRKLKKVAKKIYIEEK